jgi:molecular chaperone DnaJ
MSSKKDYYEVLGLKKGAGVEEIRKSYREAAMRCHPDRVPADKKKEAEENFKEISEAYAVLSDPQKKQLYDQYGHSGIDQNYAYEDIFKGADFSSIFRDMGGGDAAYGGSIFDSIFSDLGFDIFGGGGGESRRGRSRRGRDLEIAVAVTLEEAYHGVEKRINVPRYESCRTCSGSGAKPGTKKTACPQCKGSGRVVTSNGFFQMAQTCHKCGGQGQIIQTPCPDCGGEGRVKITRHITVKIPPGVDNGSTLRIKGEGEAGQSGSGDLYVVTEMLPHSLFNRRGADILSEIGVSLPKAVLGGEAEIDTLSGKVKMKIPAGTQSGRIFRLKGKGMPDVHGRGVTGDHLVKVDVEIPRSLNSEQRRAMEEFARASGESGDSRESFVDKFKKSFK